MEYTTTDIMLALLVGFIIGALIVWLIMRAGKGEKLKKAHLELQEKHQALQKNIDDHFEETAQAIDKLTDSYKEVFTHLSEGASHLMSKKALDKALEQRHGKSVTIAYLSDDRIENDKNLSNDENNKKVLSISEVTPDLQETEEQTKMDDLIEDRTNQGESNEKN